MPFMISMNLVGWRKFKSIAPMKSALNVDFITIIFDPYLILIDSGGNTGESTLMKVAD